MVCNIVDAGQLFTTSKRRGQLARPRRFTTPRPVHLFEPPLMRRSSFPSVSHGLVYINIPSRTCRHELIIEYEQVTAWVARFFKLEANYHQPPSALDGSMSRRTSRRHYSFWLTSNRQLEGTIGRVADTAHTRSFITRHSHLNLLWIHIRYQCQ